MYSLAFCEEAETDTLGKKKKSGLIADLLIKLANNTDTDSTELHPFLLGNSCFCINTY